MKNLRDPVYLGTCTHPHGIKGGAVLNIFSGKNTILKKGDKVLLQSESPKSSLPEDGQEFEIEELNLGNKIIAYFKGIENRNQIEAMIPFGIYFPRDLFPSVLPGEYYIQDLLGLEVVEEKTGNTIGLVKDIYENGAQSILIISCEDGPLLEVPLIPSFVINIDFQNKKIALIRPELIE